MAITQFKVIHGDHFRSVLIESLQATFY